VRIGLVQEVVPTGLHTSGRGNRPSLIARQAPQGVQGTLANARVECSQGPDAAREHLASLLHSMLRSQDTAAGCAVSPNSVGPASRATDEPD
jgi:enoyl-CoA hydratase